MTNGRHLVVGVTINRDQYIFTLYYRREHRTAGTVYNDICVLAGTDCDKISIEEVINGAKGEMITKVVAYNPINGAHIAVELLEEFGVSAALKHVAPVLLGGELNEQNFGLIDPVLTMKRPREQRKNDDNNAA